MTDLDRALLFGAIAAHLRATNRRMTDDGTRHLPVRETAPPGPRHCEDCGAWFTPHPTTGSRAFCSSCCPF